MLTVILVAIVCYKIGRLHGEEKRKKIDNEVLRNIVGDKRVWFYEFEKTIQEEYTKN